MTDIYRQRLDSGHYESGEQAVNTVQHVDCDLRVVSLLETDYIFLVSQEEVSLEQAVNELLAFLADDFLLDQSSTEIVTVHFDQRDRHVYRRFNMTWTEQGLRVTPQHEHRPISQIMFLEKLLMSSKFVG